MAVTREPRPRGCCRSNCLDRQSGHHSHPLHRPRRPRSSIPRLALEAGGDVQCERRGLKGYVSSGRRRPRSTMGDIPTGRVVRAATPALITAIAVFMILTQLGMATVIVAIIYTALIGAAALGAAPAFGLGGRDAAAQLIDS